MYDVQQRFFETIKPFQDATVQTTKSFNEAATVINDLVFDLAQRNLDFGLKLYASSEHVVMDTLKAQQQLATNYLQIFAGLPFMPGKPTK